MVNSGQAVLEYMRGEARGRVDILTDEGERASGFQNCGDNTISRGTFQPRFLEQNVRLCKTRHVDAAIVHSNSLGDCPLQLKKSVGGIFVLHKPGCEHHDGTLISVGVWKRADHLVDAECETSSNVWLTVWDVDLINLMFRHRRSRPWCVDLGCFVKLHNCHLVSS